MIAFYQDPGTWVLLLDPLLWVCGGTAVFSVLATVVYLIARRRR
jgi:hypothetical protein